MGKIFGIIFLVVVLISSVSAQSDISSVEKSVAVAWESLIGVQKINLESFHTEVGWPDSSGYHLDCTFTLNNTGNANGFATVDLETDKGQLLKKLTDLKVPKNSFSTYNVKIDVPILSFPGSDSIKYIIENQRAATKEEVFDLIRGTINLTH